MSKLWLSGADTAEKYCRLCIVLAIFELEIV